MPSDLVDRVAKTLRDTQSAWAESNDPHIEDLAIVQARAAIAVVLKTQIGYVRDGDDHTDDFKEVFEDTVRDFARESGVSLDN